MIDPTIIILSIVIILILYMITQDDEKHKVA